jgi:glycosyltransferase involved in cell wall biosynthesis
LFNASKFLFLGRLEPEKGIVELCEAFVRAYKDLPNMQLDIAGWGSLESELRRNYGEHSAIRFLGVIEGETKKDALRHATAIVVPSLVDEAFGMVAVEGFAFGKPVIGSNVGALPELIHEGSTGWLVQPGDVNSLAQRMTTVASLDPGLLRKMGAYCSEYSYEFTVEKVVDRYLGLYEQLSE